MKLVLRKLSDLDQTEQVALFRNFVTQEPEYIEEFINSNLQTYESNHLVHTKVLIDEESNELIGFFCLTMTTVNLSRRYKKNHGMYTTRDFSEYPAVEILYFAIAEKYQNNGIGMSLMIRALTNINEIVHQYVGASVVTLLSLDSAVGFYKKAGFEEQDFGGIKNKRPMLLTMEAVEAMLGEGEKDEE